MTLADFISLLLLLVGAMLTFNAEFRKKTGSSRYGKLFWGMLTPEHRIVFFRFVIGPAMMLIGGLFLYDTLTR
jgi:hypothetical protein